MKEKMSQLTPNQMVSLAKRVRVMFELAAGGCPQIYITKAEARRILRDYQLPHDDIGSVHLNSENVCSIIFAT